MKRKRTPAYGSQHYWPQQTKKNHRARFSALYLFFFFQFILAGVVSAQVTIQGTIKDENGAGLSAVTILLKGGKASAVTDESGKYSITVPQKKGVLTFSHVGYTSQQATIGTDATISLQLVLADKALDDVVVTGYGKSSKRNLSSSIVSIQAEELNSGVLASPAQLLQGKVAGLNITKSGDPNSTPAVLLRGPSTLRTDDGAQQPFYVIDGVPDASPDLIAADDIATIDILKDASATAIYGARAANGIIMITTRRAKNGQTRVSYSGYLATESASKRLDMLSGDEYRAYLKSAGLSVPPKFDDGTSNTNWQDQVQRKGFSHNHNLSFSGNSGNSTFSASVNYLNNEGIIKGSSLEKTTVRLSLETRAIQDRLKLGVTMFSNNDVRNAVPSQVFGGMINYVPTVAVKKADGTYNEDFAISWYNPVSYIDNNVDKTKIKKTLINGFAELKILPSLKYTLSVSGQNEQSNRNLYYNSLSSLAIGYNGQAYRNSYENTKKVLESYFNYDKNFGEHKVQLLAGYSWQEDHRGDGFGVKTQNFTTDGLSYNNLNFSNPPNGTVFFDNGGISTLRLISFYGRVNYNYQDKYLFQASLRRDGSSAFGANNRWGYFPAASAAWRLTGEKFLQDVSWLNDLKLRVGYGATGNSLGFPALISVYQYDRRGSFYLNGQLANAFGITQNDNPNLRWEKTATSNIGVDASFFKGRLSASVDYYIKTTTDLIANYTVPTAQFIQPILTANVGEVRNRGFEFTLNATPVKTKEFTWRSSFNISTNKNEVVSLSNDVLSVNYFLTASVGGKGQSGINKQILIAGQPIGTFNTWHYAGKDQAGLSTFQFKDGSIKAAQPTSADHRILGNAQPKFIYGWNNNFFYKNFDLNFFVRGVSGNKILNATLASLNSPNPTGVLPTNIPRFTVTEGDKVADQFTNLLSDRYLESGSYLRLDNATLGYTIKTGVKAINKLRLYVSVNNAFVITKYRGIDPEVNLGGLEPGIDNNNFYPKTRSFIGGINIIF
jgi:TonB-dependent starch-binding outer membrane protein SusC